MSGKWWTLSQWEFALQEGEHRRRMAKLERDYSRAFRQAQLQRRTALASEFDAAWKQRIALARTKRAA